MYTYLFELKGIQTYLFRTGKLRDVVTASQRLDLLIDESEQSLLSQTLQKLPYSHNLLKASGDQDNCQLNFIRCKGGAIYLWTDNKDVLQHFRQVWLLLVQQLFPALHFIEGAGHGDDIHSALNSARQALTAHQNQLHISLPINSANTAAYPRTGGVSVERNKKHSDDNKTENGRDQDALIQRTIYGKYSTDGESKDHLLFSKFSPESVTKEQFYPHNLEPGEGNFPYVQKHYDLALIHIDGNGLGAILQQLIKCLKTATQQLSNQHDAANLYTWVFRNFSAMLSSCTENAAKSAVESALHNSNYKKALPLRPLVLGGDDLTVLIRADLALEFAAVFCKQFTLNSTSTLKDIRRSTEKALKNFGITAELSLPSCLSASGGIVFQKSSQPFQAANQWVELLTQSAKALTRNNNNDLNEVGPPALSIYRIAGTEVAKMHTGDSGLTAPTPLFNGPVAAIYCNCISYLAEGKNIASIELLLKLKKWFSQHPNVPITPKLFRRMLSQLSKGDFLEANQLFERALKRTSSKQKDAVNELLPLLNPEGKPTGYTAGWAWLASDSNHLITLIGDYCDIEKYNYTVQEADHVA